MENTRNVPTNGTINSLPKVRRGGIGYYYHVDSASGIVGFAGAWDQGGRIQRCSCNWLHHTVEQAVRCGTDGYRKSHPIEVAR